MLLTPFDLKVGDDLIKFLSKSKFLLNGELPVPYLVTKDDSFIDADLLDGFSLYEPAYQCSGGNYYKCKLGLFEEITPFDEDSVKEFLLSANPIYNNWRQLNICTDDNEYIIMYDKNFVVMDIDSFFAE
jgi:hypothetical protein|nr:MAG TPA: hypothetical protein [Caudoviricetes sp.]